MSVEQQQQQHMEPIDNGDSKKDEEEEEEDDGFKFPSIYSFPPFFTRQPNEQTWHSQLAEWIWLILNYCKFYKIWRLDISSASELNLFNNKKINRHANHELIREIFIEMVKSNDAAWINESSAYLSASHALLSLAGLSSGNNNNNNNNKDLSSAIVVYWRKPQEWANVIQKWIDDTGQLGSVLTIYEITNGEQVELSNPEFSGMDPVILQQAIHILVKRGAAQYVKSISGEQAGFKLLNMK